VRIFRLVFYWFYATVLLFWAIGLYVTVLSWNSPPPAPLAARIIFVLVWLCVGVGMAGCWLSMSDVFNRFTGRVDLEAQRHAKLGRKIFFGAWVIALLLMGLGVVL